MKSRDRCRAFGVSLVTQLAYFLLLFPGDAEWAMGMVVGSQGHKWGDFIHRSGALTHDGAERLAAACLTLRGRPIAKTLWALDKLSSHPLIPPPPPGSCGRAAVMH